ncbi:hypothetical protein [Roseivirga seohaensis]|uniref:hypothetical protein n=1 Tax=Roseivirga seohaensis TaxID=1914963 RepID=UPI003BAB83C7
MNKSTFKLRPFLYSLFILIALVIITDFALPGKSFTDQVTKVQTERQQYYNAAQNYHYSYKLTTGQHGFSVSEDFAKTVNEGDTVNYRISRIFKEVNRYQLSEDENIHTDSLRRYSGLILPLLVLVVMGFAYRHGRRMSALIFVMQTLTLADLAFLIM